MRINSKWISLIEVIAAVAIFWMLTFALMFRFNPDLNKIDWKELSKSLDITNSILEQNKEIYEEAVDNFLYFKDENWNRQNSLQSLLRFVRKNNKIHYLISWLLFIKLWLIDKEVYVFSKNSLQADEKEREMLKTCLFENEYFYIDKEVNMNHDTFDNVYDQLTFIEFVNSLEEVKDYVNDRTYRNLTKARDLIEENLKKFKKEWCKEEYIDYIKKHLIKSSYNQQEEKEEKRIYLEDISKEVNIYEESITEELKKNKKEEYESILNEIRKWSWNNN